MMYSHCLPSVFDSGRYPPLIQNRPLFDELLRNPNGPLPDWESVRTEISAIFDQLYPEERLFARIQMYLPEFKMSPSNKQRFTPRQSRESDRVFEMRRHFFCHAHFSDICRDLEGKMAKKSATESERGFEQEEEREKMERLSSEAARLRQVLNAIGRIIYATPPTTISKPAPREAPKVAVCPKQEFRVAVWNAIMAKKSTISNQANKSIFNQPPPIPCKKQEIRAPVVKAFAQKKVVLERKRDRRTSHHSTPISSDLPVKTPMTSVYAVDSKRKAEEEKKTIVIPSTDEDDFDSYAQEILELTSSTTEIIALSPGYESSYEPSGSEFDSQSYGFFSDSASTDESLSEFEESSSTLDYERLDVFEKALERLLEENRKREEEQVCDEIIDNMNRGFQENVKMVQHKMSNAIWYGNLF